MIFPEGKMDIMESPQMTKSFIDSSLNQCNIIF